MKSYFPDITVFICGALVMVFELVGARVLGPYAGTSLFVWTSLIGIILGSLSIGYYFGGKTADRFPSAILFGVIVLLAGVSVLLTAIGKDWVLKYIARHFFDIRWLAVISSLILFAPGSFFLGMVSPFAVKLKLSSLKRSGMTVGNLYAISTVGSIFGTFFAGFYLIPAFGTTELVFLIALLLIFMSLILLIVEKKWIPVFLSVLMLIIGIIMMKRYPNIDAGLVDVDTQYNRVRIYETTEPVTGKVLKLFMINDERSSGMYLQSDELVFTYLNYYDLLAVFNPDFEKVLMIGGSGYAYPRHYIRKFPGKSIDVVEIDPALTQLAREHFGLKDDPSLKVFHEDARTFLNRNNEKYDAILVDVFKSQFTLPFQLTTKEFINQQYRSLTVNGVVIVNIISASGGSNQDFLLAEAKTYKSVFPVVDVYAVSDPTDHTRLQNIMLVALKNENQRITSDLDTLYISFLKNKIDLEIPVNIPVLTDDYAPVEYYCSRIIGDFYGLY